MLGNTVMNVRKNLCDVVVTFLGSPCIKIFQPVILINKIVFSDSICPGDDRPRPPGRAMIAPALRFADSSDTLAKRPH